MVKLKKGKVAEYDSLIIQKPVKKAFSGNRIMFDVDAAYMHALALFRRTSGKEHADNRRTQQGEVLPGAQAAQEEEEDNLLSHDTAIRNAEAELEDLRHKISNDPDNKDANAEKAAAVARKLEELRSQHQGVRRRADAAQSRVASANNIINDEFVRFAPHCLKLLDEEIEYRQRMRESIANALQAKQDELDGKISHIESPTEVIDYLTSYGSGESIMLQTESMGRAGSIDLGTETYSGENL